MANDISTLVAVEIARLIIGYTHNLLSEAEGEELDEWICASDHNLEIFERLIDDVSDNILNPDDVIEATDNLVELWTIMGLIAREGRTDLNEVERNMLREWREVSDRNERIYKELKNPANMQKFVIWWKQLMKKDDPGFGMN